MLRCGEKTVLPFLKRVTRKPPVNSFWMGCWKTSAYPHYLDCPHRIHIRLSTLVDNLIRQKKDQVSSRFNCWMVDFKDTSVSTFSAIFWQA